MSTSHPLVSSSISFLAYGNEKQSVEFLPDNGKAPNVGDTGALPIVYLPSIRREVLPELRWAIRGFVTEPGVTFLSGVAKSGKSQLALRMAIALASGIALLGKFEVAARRRVLYAVGEDWLPHIIRRIESHALDMGLTAEAIKKNVLPNIQIVPVCGLRLDDPRQADLLCSALDALGHDVLIVDPLARFHHLDEDKASSMGPLLRKFREIGDSRVLIIVHHEGKPREGGSTPVSLGHRSRGTSAFADLHDNYIALTKTRAGFRIEREHKYEASPDPIEVVTTQADDGVHWETSEPVTPASIPARVLEFVTKAPGCSTQDIKKAVTGRTESIVQALNGLEVECRIRAEVTGQAKRWFALP